MQPPANASAEEHQRYADELKRYGKLAYQREYYYKRKQQKAAEKQINGRVVMQRVRLMYDVIAEKGLTAAPTLTRKPLDMMDTAEAELELNGLFAAIYAVLDAPKATRPASAQSNAVTQALNAAGA